MARLPFVQEGTARDQVQEARLADDIDSVLVSALPVALEHVNHVQRLVAGRNLRRGGGGAIS